jgi:hypothetical protein
MRPAQGSLETLRAVNKIWRNQACIIRDAMEDLFGPVLLLASPASRKDGDARSIDGEGDQATAGKRAEPAP